MVEDIFNAISKTETCYYVDSFTSKKFKEFHKVICIDTEITFNEKLLDVKLYVAFPKNLKVNLPKIFIDENSYEPIKYIPHINSDLSICLLDESENFTFDSEMLPSITLYLIEKAKSIIRIKQDLNSTSLEFQREFYAYWGIKYSTKDKEMEKGLSLLNPDGGDEVKAIKLKNKIANYEYLIYNDEKLFANFKPYLELNNIKYSEINTFIIDYKRVDPPFDLTYFDSYIYLSTINDPHFKRIFNHSLGSDILIIFKKEYNEFYGWIYPRLMQIPKGFREKSNWEKLQMPFTKDLNVERISFSNITPERLSKRTNGEIIHLKDSVNVIGLGSVGSNLLHFLSKLPLKKMILVDKDCLKVENVFRHNYGFNYLLINKARIARTNLLDKNPFIQIDIHQKDIIEVLEHDPLFLNNVDYTFIVIGITRIEAYLLDYMHKNSVPKPVFLIWVEPYLASGQIMYITPKDFNKAKNILLNFPYHVLGNNNRLYLKEGSCQTGYYPYSETYLTLFLSSVFPYIYDIVIKHKGVESKIYSWIGDLDYISSMGFNFNQLGESFSLKIENL